jgi:hypothetical protein
MSITISGNDGLSSNGTVYSFNPTDLGVPLTPNRPFFQGSYTIQHNATNRIILNAYISQRNITYNNNGTITVPAPGLYFMWHNGLGQSGGGACQTEMRVNGAYLPGSRQQDTNSANDNFCVNILRLLNAGDTIEFWVIQGGVHNNADYNSCGLVFLG